jgi:hypothetical protein
MENEKSQQTKESAKQQKPNSNKKERPAIVRKMIAEERQETIRLDLELSFISDCKTKNLDVDTEIGPSEDELKKHYEYHLARLNFFKSLRDKMAPMKDEDVKAVKEDVEKNSPADLKVKKEVKE